jgi:hypothetical protein
MYILFVLNGIYDILCACSILRIIKIPIFGQLHVSMFHPHPNEITKRLLAYWIFTYGVMRLSNQPYMIAMSYGLEASFFLHEYYQHSVDPQKAGFVIVTMILLSVAALSLPPYDFRW